jgi:hypothetical protein
MLIFFYAFGYGPHFEIHGLPMLSCSVAQGLLLYVFACCVDNIIG